MHIGFDAIFVYTFAAVAHTHVLQRPVTGKAADIIAAAITAALIGRMRWLQLIWDCNSYAYANPIDFAINVFVNQ